MTVVVDAERCTGCGVCVRACPEANVIRKTADGKVAIAATLCKMCLLCAASCPRKAIGSEGRS